MGPEERKRLAEQAKRELLRRRAREDYYSYVQYVHPRIYKPNRAAELVCRTAQDFLRKDTGNPYDILIRHGAAQHEKHELTETFASWYLGNTRIKALSR